jgi:hypothetical protein
MAEKDYLLRLIEQVGRMLVELRRMLLGGAARPGDAEERLQRIAGRGGLDLDVLRSVDLDTMVMLMSPGGEPEPGRCWMAAELFLVDGERARASGDDEEARDRWERALRLYAILDPGIVARGFPKVRERIGEVTRLLGSLAPDRGDG